MGINNSVNFPTTRLNNRPENAVRVTIVNKNVPGMLAHITEAFGDFGLNILQQINASRGTVAYNVVDVELPENKDGGVVCFKKLQERITMVDGVLSSNIIY